MFNVFDSVKGLLKIDSVCNDNNVFRLHYKVTVIILITFSALVTSRQYIGNPIDCIVDGVPTNVMNGYCWIYSTFTIDDRNGSRVGKDEVQPGVSANENDIEQHYHGYYQWVCFTLFFQAMFFYMPRYVWKIWEGGRIKMLVLGLDCPILSEEFKAGGRRLLVNYFATKQYNQNIYALQFFLCEFLNLVNVVVQIFFIDYFLDGEFSTYGWDVLRFTEMEPEYRRDPMARVFPKVTKCTFRKYGPSGTIQKLDGLCVLPLNIVNEKIYVFLWFWFWFVAVISGVHLVYRAAVITMPKLRSLLLRNKSRQSSWAEIELFVQNYEFGEWFVLYQLSKNIDPLIFKELLSDMTRNLIAKKRSRLHM